MLPDFSFTLHGEAFDVMKTGEKLKEFRENTDYWRARLLNADGSFRKFKHLTFINGMTKARNKRFKARWVSTCYVDSVNESYTNGFVLEHPHQANGYFCITFELIE